MSSHTQPTSHRPKISRLNRYQLKKIFSNTKTNCVSTIPDLANSLPLSQISHQTPSFIQPNFKEKQKQYSYQFKLKKFKFQSKKSFRLWCTTITVATALILLGSIIATIVLLTARPHITTTTTSTTATTSTSTTATTSTSTSSTSSTTSTTSSTSTSSSTTSTSSSTSTTSTSTSSSTTSTTSTTRTTSTTSTSSTSSTSTSTSSTRTTATTTTTTTTQNPSLGHFEDNSVTANTWTQCKYSYYATKSSSVTLKFSFETNVNYDWYLDDISVKDSSSTELITNGNFEQSSSLSGWSTGAAGFCGSSFGLTTSGCHASTKCYYTSCDIHDSSIYQSFSVLTNHIYNVTFWFYLKHHNSWWVLDSVEMDVTIN